MDEFTLTIALGNEAMQTTDDVAAALIEVANKLLAGQAGGFILDANGNPVGEWSMPD